MAGFTQGLSGAYRRMVLARPRTALAVLFLLLAFFSYPAKDFTLDASPDSLLLEDDVDLQLFRQVSARYQTRALLIVTFTPHGDLFSDEVLSHLGRLRDQLRSIENVDSVTSLLDVPLVRNSDFPLVELADHMETLESSTVDRERAREELTGSPIYRDLIVSRDNRTTALLVTLKRNEDFSTLQTVRNELLIKSGSGQLAPDERLQLPGL